jgi:hypothetical protein
MKRGFTARRSVSASSAGGWQLSLRMPVDRRAANRQSSMHGENSGYDIFLECASGAGLF